jgi:hypothetical protein
MPISVLLRGGKNNKHYIDLLLFYIVSREKMGNEEKIGKQPINKHDSEIKIDNSEILKHTLFSLVHVSSLKTSDDYAWAAVKKLIRELKNKYLFLNYIQIGNISYLNYTIEDIKISPEINDIDPKELGKAIQDIVDLVKKYLGEKAGHFFIQEFREILGDTYHSIIKKMGVDLRLVELQDQYSCFEPGKYKIKDDKNSNIAFVEKAE